MHRRSGLFQRSHRVRDTRNAAAGCWPGSGIPPTPLIIRFRRTRRCSSPSHTGRPDGSSLRTETRVRFDSGRNSSVCIPSSVVRNTRVCVYFFSKNLLKHNCRTIIVRPNGSIAQFISVARERDRIIKRCPPRKTYSFFFRYSSFDARGPHARVRTTSLPLPPGEEKKEKKKLHGRGLLKLGGAYTHYITVHCTSGGDPSARSRRPTDRPPPRLFVFVSLRVGRGLERTAGIFRFREPTRPNACLRRPRTRNVYVDGRFYSFCYCRASYKTFCDVVFFFNDAHVRRGPRTRTASGRFVSFSSRKSKKKKKKTFVVVINS